MQAVNLHQQAMPTQYNSIESQIALPIGLELNLEDEELLNAFKEMVEKQKGTIYYEMMTTSMESSMEIAK
jgi:Ca2+-binding EF-hand superfamily protein